ncbi:MAG TPA: Mrp/NBP35 family ATP-binding protein [Actinomycetota bacterium]|nr:Mrp/NBP35 family ATP-binding protein [Actinomycetota bacterium]
MPTIEQIRSVLAGINDPEIHRSIVELNMVRGIDLQGSTVTVDLALTIPGCPLKSYFQEVLPAKLKDSFPDITDVRINLGAMTEEERKALVGGLRADDPIAPLARPDSATTVIAVGSGKGGVGKSTTTVNLAAALAKRGHTVGLLDADVWGFSIPRMLGLREDPTMIDERLIIPLTAHGFKTISIGNFVPEDRPIVWRGPMLHKALQQFLSDVHWEDPEYLLIDMPPGTGDIAISLSKFAPGTRMILVTTPQTTAVRVAERAGHMAVNVGMTVGGVIENMAYAVCDHCGERTYPFGIGGGEELADLFDAPLLGQVPLDPPMRDFADNGVPSVVGLPDSLSALAFDQIVDAFEKYFPVKPKPAKRRNLPLIMGPMPAHGGHSHN